MIESFSDLHDEGEYTVHVDDEHVAMAVAAIESALTECASTVLLNMMWGYSRKGHLSTGPIHKVTNEYYQNNPGNGDTIILELVVSVDRESLWSWNSETPFAKFYQHAVDQFTERDRFKEEAERAAKKARLEQLEAEAAALREELDN